MRGKENNDDNNNIEIIPFVIIKLKYLSVKDCQKYFEENRINYYLFLIDFTLFLNLNKSLS